MNSQLKNKAITVAHFRRAWFLKTETFLYNYITNLKKTFPILIGYSHENKDNFPVSCPIITLYEKATFSAFMRRLRIKLLGELYDKHFDCAKTYREIKKAKVNVLHAHFGYTGYYVLPIKKHFQLPLVTTFYGEDVSRLANEPFWKTRYKELFKNGDLFLVEGPFMKNRLVEIGCPVEKIAIQRIAIKCDKYPFRQRSPKKINEPVLILFCASFREKKGLKYALEAVRKAHDESQNIVFRIIGDGYLRPEIEKIITEQRMSDYTKLLGFLSHDRAIHEMNDCDIFIHPSVTGAEGDSEGGAPTTILEAQACGMPVLSTYHADIPNIVKEGESALLSPERDVESLYVNLMKLIKEPNSWAGMGIAGRNFIEKYHDISKEVDHLEQHYCRLARNV